MAVTPLPSIEQSTGLLENLSALGAAVRGAGLDPGGRVDLSDIKLALRKYGYDPGGRVDESDARRLIREHVKRLPNIKPEEVDAVANNIIIGRRTLDQSTEKFGGNTQGVKHLDLDEIRSALSAISAKYGVDRSLLEQARGSVTNSSKRALQLIDRGKKDSLTSFRSGAAGRGVLRSGLAVKDTGRISEDFAQSRADAVNQRDDALRAIQTNLAGLKTQETAARAAEARRLAKSQVGTQEAISRALKLA